MKVLLVTTDFPPAIGGIQAVLYRTALNFNHLEVAVIAPDHPGARAFDQTHPFSIHRVRGRETLFGGSIALLARIALASLKVLSREKVDVVLCGHPFTAPVGLVARLLMGKPYVVWTHAAELIERRRFLRFFLRPADAVLVISAYTGRLVAGLGVQQKKMALIPYAPDCDLASIVSPQSSVSNNHKVLLTVARMSELYKGHDTMLRAMPLIKARVPNVRWVVVGEGSLRPYYERMAGTLGVRDAVQFTGALSHTERDKLLESCDLFVMVSRDRKIDGGGEGFGLVYLEANAFGKPVVAGRAGGAIDAVVDGVTGILVDPESELELAEAVVALLENPERAAELGRQGRERVRRNLTWKRTATAVEEVLEAARRRKGKKESHMEDERIGNRGSAEGWSPMIRKTDDPGNVSHHDNSLSNGKVKREVRGWWERNPMTYHLGAHTLTEGTEQFFEDIDYWFRYSNWFAQDPGRIVCTKLIDYLQLAGKQVLEIGCGAGTVAGELARCGSSVIATDLTERAVGLTRKRFALHDLPGTVLCADAENLPFDDNKFDYAWSWGVLCHTPDAAKGIQEIYRVLKPGGKAAIMVYHKNSLRYYGWILFVRGVLQIKLLKHSPEELANVYSNYGTVLARYFTVKDFVPLFAPFTNVTVKIFGLRSDLFPRVHWAVRSERHWTDGLCRLVLSQMRLGHFLFVEAQK